MALHSAFSSAPSSDPHYPQNFWMPALIPKTRWAQKYHPVSHLLLEVLKSFEVPWEMLRPQRSLSLQSASLLTAFSESVVVILGINCCISHCWLLEGHGQGYTYTPGSVGIIPCHSFNDLTSENMRKKKKKKQKRNLDLLGILHHNNLPPLTIAPTKWEYYYIWLLKEMVVFVSWIYGSQAVLLLTQSTKT